MGGREKGTHLGQNPEPDHLAHVRLSSQISSWALVPPPSPRVFVWIIWPSQPLWQPRYACGPLQLNTPVSSVVLLCFVFQVRVSLVIMHLCKEKLSLLCKVPSQTHPLWPSNSFPSVDLCRLSYLNKDLWLFTSPTFISWTPIKCLILCEGQSE